MKYHHLYFHDFSIEKEYKQIKKYETFALLEREKSLFIFSSPYHLDICTSDYIYSSDKHKNCLYEMLEIERKSSMDKNKIIKIVY